MDTQSNLPHVQSTTHTFFHEWVSLNSKTNELSFSNEAKIALQENINKITIESPQISSPEISDESLSQVAVDAVLDAMIVEWKPKKSIKKFIERVSLLLGSKKKSSKEITHAEKKVEKKIEKYIHYPRIEILIQYQDEDFIRTIDDVPMTIWQWHDLNSMILSINTRLRYKHVIYNKKETPKK